MSEMLPASGSLCAGCKSAGMRACLRLVLPTRQLQNPRVNAGAALEVECVDEATQEFLTLVTYRAHIAL